MKLLFQVLLLVVMFTLQKSQEADIESVTDPAPEYDFVPLDLEDGPMENAVFNITVYRQMEDREADRVIVVCMSEGYSRWIKAFELSVESKLNYTKETVDCTSLDNEITCVFMVTVGPPASFTCEREVHSNGDFKIMSTQTYTYKRSVLDHHEEGVSSFCIGSSSFLAVGLFIMTVAVIVTTIRSKAKDSINHPTTVTDNDYMDA